MNVSLIGRRLGKYEIQSEIGRGGMGMVYRGFDPTLQRTVAVKVLPPQLAMDPNFVRRFQREAILAAQLKHPNIVTIHDVGEHEDINFIVMEYLEGATLDRWLSRGLLSLDQVNRIVHQVADALDYAHKRGVVHRDIKPSNIMVAEDGHVTLMDFGLVRASEGAALTQTGAIMGTPEYMAPEQAQGTTVDYRADIYAFGIVIYRLLVGQLPFERNTTPALMHAHVYEAPPPPRQLRPELPVALEGVVLKAIAKQPADRYQSAGQLAREFETAISSKAPAVAAALPPPAAPASTRPSTTPATGAATVRPGARSTAPAAPVSAPAANTTRPRTQPPVAPQAASKMPILIGLLAVGLVVLIGGALLMMQRPAARPESTVVISTTALPATTAPKATAQPPTATAQPPTDTSEPPTATYQPPTATSRPPTATSRPPTATPQPPTATSRPPTNTPVPPTKAPTATKPPAPPARPGLVLDFEQDQTWRRGNEPYGTFTRSAEQVKAGASSGKLSYDFPAVANNYVVFELRPAKALPGQPTGLTAWVYGDGSGHFLNVWLKDKAGEVRAYSFGRIQHQGWQQMIASLDSAAPWPAGHISGPDNGVLDYPASFFAFVLDGVPDGSASSGAIYLDEVFITTEAIPATPTAPPSPPQPPGGTTTSSAQLSYAPSSGALAATGTLLSLGLLIGMLLLSDWPARLWHWLWAHGD